MAKKKNKQANAKKKLGALLGKMDKKRAQIDHKKKQLKSLQNRAAKIIAQNPELKPPAADAPKSASRSKKASGG